MSSTDLIESCTNGVFPSIATVTKYGLDGYGGTNPVAVFSCYQSAIVEDSLDADTIEEAWGNGELNKLILENSYSVKFNKYYENVCKMGGIKLSPYSIKEQGECGGCNRCACHEDGVCSNCGTIVKI